MSRMVLLGVYTAFFSVQLVNAYLNLNNSIPSAESHIVSAISSKKNVLVYSNSKSAKKPAIRLNTRFHPEAIVTIGYVPLASCVQLLSRKVISKPQDYLLISSILTDSLRGPPLVVEHRV